MKALFDRAALQQAVQVAASVIPPRAQKVILQNVLLTATKKGVCVKATDMETVGITIGIKGAQVEESGDILLPASQANNILRECTAEGLKVSGDEDGIIIAGGFSEFDLPGQNPNQYPDFKGFEAEKYYSIGSASLKELIQKTLFSVAKESARFALTGVMWEFAEKGIKLVATDGRRIAIHQSKAAAKGNPKPPETPVVPTKVMRLLEQQLPESDEPALVSIGTNEALFKVGSTEIYGRLVEGRFPSYKDIYPKKVQASIPLSVGHLLHATRQAGVLTDDDSWGVDFAFAKGTLTLQSKIPEKGRSKVQLPIAYEGKSILTRFDPKLIVDFLRTLEADSEVMLDLVENQTIAQFRTSGEHHYLIVPLRSGE